MQTELTLRLDDALIRKAERWAASRGISLSDAVASFFAQLPTSGDSLGEFSPWLQQLTGVAATANVSDADQLELAYVDFLNAKYR